MEANDWTSPLDDAGNWWCEHTNSHGEPAPPTQLNAAAAQPEHAPGVSSVRRSRLYCPDCGTLWRVWPDQYLAKYYVTYSAEEISSIPSWQPPRFRHAPTRDIDSIIAALQETFPTLAVTQWQYVFPADDDGIWWFDLPERKNAIQLESWSGMCPFSVDSDAYSGSTVRMAETVEAAVHLIAESFTTVSKKNTTLD